MGFALACGAGSWTFWAGLEPTSSASKRSARYPRRSLPPHGQIACIRAVVRKKEVANSLRQNREGDAREIDLEASLMSELSSCPVPKLGPFEIGHKSAA